MATQKQLQHKPGPVEKHRVLSLFVFFWIGCFVCLLLNRNHSNDGTRADTHPPRIQPVSKAVPAAKFISNDVDNSDKDGIVNPLLILCPPCSIPVSCRLNGGDRTLTWYHCPPETLVTLGIRLQI